MNVSLRDIVLAVRYGDAALVGESSGYLVLGAADQALDVPRRISLDGIFLSDDGAISIDAAPCTFADCERDLRIVLGQLLSLVRTPCPNLSRVAQRGEICGVDHLVRELEAALVPVNRKAARRSLGRLARETLRAAKRVHEQARVEELPAPINETLTPLVQAEELAMEVEDAEIYDTSHRPPATVAVAQMFQNPPAKTPPPPSSRASTASQEVQARVSRQPTLRVDSEIVATFAMGFGARTPSDPGAFAVQEKPLDAPSPPPPATQEPSTDLDDAPTLLFHGAAQVTEVAGSEQSKMKASLSQETASEQLLQVMDAETLEFSPLELSPARPPQVALRKAPNAEATSELAASLEPECQSLERAPSTSATVVAQSPRQSETGRVSVASRKAPILPSVSLIPQAQPPAQRRPSDIDELLDRMPLSQEPDDELFNGLKSLSRVEMSPAAPPVAAAWMDESA